MNIPTFPHLWKRHHQLDGPAETCPEFHPLEQPTHLQPNKHGNGRLSEAWQCWRGIFFLKKQTYWMVLFAEAVSARSAAPASP
jgi:hypothetical protein